MVGWSGSPLDVLVYRMAYPLVRVEFYLTRGKALLLTRTSEG